MNRSHKLVTVRKNLRRNKCSLTWMRRDLPFGAQNIPYHVPFPELVFADLQRLVRSVCNQVTFYPDIDLFACILWEFFKSRSGDLALYLTPSCITNIIRVLLQRPFCAFGQLL